MNGGRERESRGVSKFKINVINDQNLMAGGLPCDVPGRGQHVFQISHNYFLVIEIQYQRINFAI